MEQIIPRVFGAALGCSRDFQKQVFAAIRGLETNLSLTSAAVQEGAPDFLICWRELVERIRSSAGERGKVAHAGLSIYGGGVIIEVDENGCPNGVVRRAGPPVASLSKQTKAGREEISEREIRDLADRLLAITHELGQLVGDISVRKRSA